MCVGWGGGGGGGGEGVLQGPVSACDGILFYDIQRAVSSYKLKIVVTSKVKDVWFSISHEMLYF